ncbi:hypothetical protein [uncultured Winogradskyella sp.]|uniref:hypothetical protein n=1 Tax=uncultured Winogradskyella sp. TaxID=395353 RepID=UPI0026093BB9|nr:hypothetical protein [uncultured Winogradskyella sp.]
MSENTKPTPQNEEVDLGQLFKMIGQLFRDLSKFFRGIFVRLFRIIIYTLKPFVNNIKMISIVLALSAAIGFIAQRYSAPVYSSDMLVKPYFESKYQLADNIEYFNALINEKNINEISRIFEIDSSDSASLIGFDIEIGPQTKNDLIQEYDGFLKTIDSSIAVGITFKDYVDNRDVLNGTTFVITAKSIKRDVFKDLEGGFTRTFENKYSQKNKKIRDSSIVIQRTKLLRDLKRVDSVQKIYLQVLKTDSEKQSGVLPSGAFPLAQEKTQTKEYELLQEEIKIRDELKLLDEQQIVESDFYDVLSTFEEIGTVEPSFYKNFKFTFPLATLILIILLTGLYKIFYFIKDYE